MSKILTFPETIQVYKVVNPNGSLLVDISTDPQALRNAAEALIRAGGAVTLSAETINRADYERLEENLRVNIGT